MTILDKMEAADFILKHGSRTTDRMVPDLLSAVRSKFDGAEINYNGKSCQIKCLGEPYQGGDGEWKMLFDVKNPDETFDHVEFLITKTGWGRSL